MDAMQDRVQVFNEYRPLLFGIAYRMLGSAMDAEDLVQETFLRWQQAREQPVESPRAYLATIITRLSIDRLRSAQSQREQYVGPWLPEPLLTGEMPAMTESLEMAESISTAFLLVLQTLSPIERAVFLLRQVFGYEYAEIAQIVDKSESNVRQLVHRAQTHVRRQRPRFETTRAEQEQVVAQFGVACATGNLEGLLELLAPDVVLQADSGGKVHAARQPIRGADRVARFIFGLLDKVPADFASEAAEINGQPAFVSYMGGKPYNVTMFEISKGRVQAINIVINPDKLRRIPAQQTPPSPMLPTREESESGGS
jgi:RNA polymerase sigma-70 factor (ECF subfamily)